MANPSSVPAFQPAVSNPTIPGPVAGSKAAPRFMPAGPAMPTVGRPNIVFGSADSRAGSTPGSTHASLATPLDNRRITSPAASPSPIPKPMIASGGPPPSMANPTNVTFGNIRSDGSYPGPNFGSHNSPGPQYRQPQARPIPHQYQPAGPGGIRPHTGSPFQPATRSPAMANAALHQPVPGTSPAPYAGYPQHGVPPQYAMNGPGMQTQVPYGNYYPQFMPGMQHGYSGAPSSPRMYPGQVPAYPNQYHPNGPVMPAGSHGMDRTMSGSVGSPHVMGAHPHGAPSVQQPGVAGSGSTTFSRPPPRSKAIPIMTPEGNVVKVDDAKPSVLPKAETKSDLVIVSSTPVGTKVEPVKDTTAQLAQRTAEFQKQFREQLKAREDQAKQQELTKNAETVVSSSEPVVETTVQPLQDKQSSESETSAAPVVPTEAQLPSKEEEKPVEVAKPDSPKELSLGELNISKEVSEPAKTEIKTVEEVPPAVAALPQTTAPDVAEKVAEPVVVEEISAESKVDSAPPAEASSPAVSTLDPSQTEGSAATKFTPSAAMGAPTSLPKSVLGLRPKPDPLSIPSKPTEPGAPTPGMLSLKSARPIDRTTDKVEYPEEIKAPQAGVTDGNKYDIPFLLQFREVFREKPETDWELRVKGTVGDTTPGSARGAPAAMSRQSSRAGVNASSMGAMGNFSSMGSRMGTLDGRTQSRPMGMMSQGSNRPGGLSFNLPPGGRSGSHAGGPAPLHFSSRQGSSRGRMSRRGDKPPQSNETTDAQKAKEQSGGSFAAPSKSAEPVPAAPPVRRPRFGPKETLEDGSLNPAWVSSRITYSLNRLAPDNFDRILPEMEEIIAKSTTESDGRTLNTVINMIFEKACSESKWSELYARTCSYIYSWLGNPDGPGSSIHDVRHIKKNTTEPMSGAPLFRTYLLTKCQQKFEEGEKTEELEEPSEEDTEMMSDEYYKQIRDKTFRLGLFRFIGELYKLEMVSDKIIVECMRTLMGQSYPDEPSVERLNCLLRTIGPHVGIFNRAILERSRVDSHAKMSMDRCFNDFQRLIEKQKTLPDDSEDPERLPKRPLMILLNLIEFRKRNWQDALAVSTGPTTITEIHREVAQKQELERQQHQTQRSVGRLPQLGRGDARSFSGPTSNPSLLSMDDLSKLRQQQGGPAKSSERKLGPPGFALSNSRRNGRTGSNLTRGGTDSHSSSRTGTPKDKDSMASARMNAFSALQSLDTEGTSEDVKSIRSEQSPPPPIPKEPVAATQQPVSTINA